MSIRYVRNWMFGASMFGFLVAACGGPNTTFPNVGGSSGEGGTSAGAAGSDQSGAGGSNAGADSGTAGSGTAGSGGSSAGSGGTTNTGGSGGTSGELGYDPFGIGDPWFFSSAGELEAFEVELTGATGSAAWNEAGEVHLPLTFSAAGDQALIHFTAPWDSVANALSPMDLGNRVMRARVRVASATATGGVQAYSQSTTGWAWVNGDWSNFADLGSWHDVEFDFAAATAPSEVLRFGLQVYATSAGGAELIIDDIQLAPKPVQPGPDGGVVQEGDGGSEPPPVDGDAGAPDAGGYDPVGLGDPWFFDAEPEMSAFAFEVGGGASESHAWSNGEVHIAAGFAASGDTVAMHFTTPWNGSINAADLSGRVIRARVQIAGGATADGGVQVFAQSGGWGWAAGDWNGAASLGSYTDVSMPMTSAGDATSVQRFGIQFYATAAGSLELIIDDFRLEPAD